MVPQLTLVAISAELWRAQGSVLDVVLATLKLPEATRTVIAVVRVHLVISRMGGL